MMLSMPVASIASAIQDFALTWLPVMFFALMCVVVYLLWRTLKVMPRVKPTEISPGSSSAVSWADVAGLDEAQAELQEVVDFLRDPKRFERLGARVPKGILLHGPPGTGKTLAAKAVANASGARFFAQSASAFVEMYAGLGASRIRKLFEEARKNAPSIVFIDELDAVGRTRSGHSHNREQDQTLNQLLVELDGFGPRDQVVVMAASNRLQDLDPALLRPGRFDRQILVQQPDLRGRIAILGVHSKGKPLATDVDLDNIARQTAGLTGADLANICNEAAICAGRRDAELIARLRLRPRNGPGDRGAPAAPRRHRQGEADPRLPRGRARAGGAPRRPRSAEGDDHRSRERARLRAPPVRGGALSRHEGGAARLDGRDARGPRRRAGRLRPRHERSRERPREGDRIARSMVFEYGMGESAVSRTMRADNYALSEETKRMRDQEQARLTDDAYEEALRILAKHRPLLDRIAAALLEKETLSREELLEIFGDGELESRASEAVGVVRALAIEPGAGA